MKKVICLFLLLICFSTVANANDSSRAPISQLSKLQQVRSLPKLYLPNFILIDKDAIFKVIAKPNSTVKLVMDYGSHIPTQTFEKSTNENGIVVFNIHILADTELVGKSVAIDAFVLDNNNEIKAIIQNENGAVKNSNRVYITDNASEKGFLFAPWQAVNTLIMNYDYDENSGYNPVSEQIYTNNTPIYIRNMRDAQDNVREIPTNSGYSN